jgi:hypothetical protein
MSSALICLDENARNTIIDAAPTMQPNILWKEVLGAAGLVVFAVIGVGHVVRPDRFTPSHLRQRYGLPMARLTTQIFGVVIAGFAIYVLYHIFLRD